MSNTDCIHPADGLRELFDVVLAKCWAYSLINHPKIYVLAAASTVPVYRPDTACCFVCATAADGKL
jgi:hypothetical protein